jgi:hypothetical protein
MIEEVKLDVHVHDLSNIIEECVSSCKSNTDNHTGSSNVDDKLVNNPCRFLSYLNIQIPHLYALPCLYDHK